MAKRKHKRERQPLCPVCGKSDVIPFVYGLPGPELVELANRGEVMLGGCCVPGLADWHCRACGHEWLKGDAKDDGSSGAAGD